ncbi:glycosyltransferase [Pseudooceanicola nanhaiensis]|uniref:glycosyltransferase n=1 Tax=Pseudooceanicola nanhaiensis TaxID=375761 RepID=UPI001CD5EAB6|nr:glycosyltransferase [Pseudooceanicola nanhaiensis]MCA0921799.1 putative rhamnosyl transferase [Pseudooceanicola nanhaiensis]
MQIVYLVRYSFFGSSGWRSPASKDPGLLFEPSRLEKRARFFEQITLASLRAQTDTDFHVIVLSSEGMPRRFKTQLREATQDALGPRGHVLFNKPARAGSRFRQYLLRNLADAPFTAQVVLDDDDAVATDFTATLRAEADLASRQLLGPRDYCFLSFARGVSGIFSPELTGLHHRVSPFTNLGLTLVAPTQTARSPFFVAHKRLAPRHPARLIYNRRPLYLRAVHDTNDSRAQVADDPVTEAQRAMVLERFPFLAELEAQPLTVAAE